MLLEIFSFSSFYFTFKNVLLYEHLKQLYNNCTISDCCRMNAVFFFISRTVAFGNSIENTTFESIFLKFFVSNGKIVKMTDYIVSE